MTTSGPAAVNLFYSYAHRDEPLCRELQKHLTALKRCGLIRDWYDGSIQHGSEWAAKIQEAMEHAGIILLLISADFLASPFIAEIELPFALKRHDSGHATVIPVLLRPVEWRDAPFAKLQVLPSHARPVTLWRNRDEAFSDVAGRLRELVYGQRLRELNLPFRFERQAASTRTQERVLDAAIASSVIVDEPTDLVTMVRTTASGGLQAILRVDRSYSPVSEDVRSKTFELGFPLDASGNILPSELGLLLESPGFDPSDQFRKIRIPVTGDSDVAVFMLTPKRQGGLRLNLRMMSGDVEIGSRSVVTRSVSAAASLPSVSYTVVSAPMLSMEGPSIRFPTGKPIVVEGFHQTSVPLTSRTAAPSSAPREVFTPSPAAKVAAPTASSSPPARAASRGPVWAGIGMAVALMLSAVGYFALHPENDPPPPNSAATAEPKPVKKDEITRPKKEQVPPKVTPPQTGGSNPIRDAGARGGKASPDPGPGTITNPPPPPPVLKTVIAPADQLVSDGKRQLTDHDDAAARESFRKASDAGNPQAMVLLGVMYAQGLGGPRNEADAVSMFQLASELGYAAGTYNLGLMYEAGRGVAADPARAADLYEKATEQKGGNPSAAFRLGVMYELGRGVPKDIGKARKYYEMSGTPEAKAALAKLAPQ